MLIGMAKPTPVALAGFAGDGRVDGDDLAVEVHQRAAAVAGIDRRVGLEEVLDVRLRSLAEGQTVPPRGADDAEGDRPAQSEGTPHGEDEIAGLHAVAVADGSGDQIRSLDRQDGDVGVLVAKDLLRTKRASVGQVDLDSFGRGGADDMPVRQHIVLALHLDDHPGALFLAPPAAAVLKTVVDGALRLDVDHGGANQFGGRLEDRGLGLEHGEILVERPLQFGALFPCGRPAAVEHRGKDGLAADRRRGGGKQQRGRQEETAIRNNKPARHRRRPPCTVLPAALARRWTMPGVQPRRPPHETSNSMSLIDRSASLPETSSKRLQSTSLAEPAPWRSASRWHLMQ